MTKVKIHGFSRNEVREFEILNRTELEKIIEELNPAEIFTKTFEKAMSYLSHSGITYTYIDARDGKIYSSWLGQNTFNHPWDSFYEIWLCSLKTGAEAIDLNDPFFLLNDDEQREFLNCYEGTAEDFLLEKYGQEELEERIQNAIDWLAMEFSFDWENIQEQLDDLYNRSV